jgi:hypothetical protein
VAGNPGETLGDPIAEAAAIETSGRLQALANQLGALLHGPRLGMKWHAQVLWTLAHSATAEYMSMKAAYDAPELDPCLVAWRARNLLELMVWSGYCMDKETNARRFYEDAGRDQKNLLSHTLKLGSASGGRAQWMQQVKRGMAELHQQAVAQGIDKLDECFLRVEDAADVVDKDLRKLFRYFNKELSKFVHPTALALISPRTDEQRRAFNHSFYSHGCAFYVGAFYAIEDALKKEQAGRLKRPPG